MKRLGWPQAKESRWGIAVLALLTVLVMSGCGNKKASLDGSSNGTTNQNLLTDAGGSQDVGTSDVGSVVSGAFDQSQQQSGALSGGSQPSNIGSASQAQSFCSAGFQGSSASGSGSSFFTQLTQPTYYGSSQDACFTGQVSPNQLMYASYGEIAVIYQCQAIALSMLQQTPNDQYAILGLFQQATIFVPQCVVGAIERFEGRLGYGSYLTQGALTRIAALKGATNQLLQGLHP